MKKRLTDLGQEKLLKEITHLLNKARIPYMVTGALGVIFYGRPRASHDLDFVIEAESKDTPMIIRTFQTLAQEFLIDPRAIRDAIQHKKHFNILHLPTVLKLDFFLLENEPFDRERFKRRKNVRVFGQMMTFASPEDTILIKLLWYKQSKIEKHLIDAAFIYQIQKDKLDKRYLEQWARIQHVTKLLHELPKIDLEKHY